MRLVYRNRRAALVGLLCVFGVMMLLMKYTELGPTCMFREEQQSVMVRDDVSVIHLIFVNLFLMLFREQYTIMLNKLYILKIIF